MNRRQLLAGFVIAPFAALFATTEALGEALPKRELTDAEKQAIVARALRTPEGRAKLAAAMMQPIRCGGRDYPRGRA